MPVEKPTPSGRSNLILVVDDDRIVLDIMSQFLSHLGYRSILVENGQEAIDICARDGDQIGLVILDMFLQDMGNTAVYTAIKRINPDLKVVFSSGSEPDALGEILVNDVAGFLKKPFSVLALSSLLDDVMNMDAASRP